MARPRASSVTISLPDNIESTTQNQRKSYSVRDQAARNT
jgi:hypothetical protein